MSYETLAIVAFLLQSVFLFELHSFILFFYVQVNKRIIILNFINVFLNKLDLNKKLITLAKVSVLVEY